MKTERLFILLFAKLQEKVHFRYVIDEQLLDYNDNQSINHKIIVIDNFCLMKISFWYDTI